MKQNLLYLLLGIFLLASCQKEDLPEAETAMGMLSLNGISVQVANETVSSRGVDADLYVDIMQDNDTLYSYKPGAVPEKIELPEGRYKLRIYNDAYKAENPYEGKGQAIYLNDTTSVNIQAGQVTRLDSIKVPMINFGVQFQFPETYEDFFLSCSLSVKVDERTVDLQSGETAYFPYAEGAIFSYALTATNTDGEKLKTDEKTYGEDQNISSGTIYTVSYKMETRSLSVAE